jgi:hypothetical protein
MKTTIALPIALLCLLAIVSAQALDGDPAAEARASEARAAVGQFAAALKAELGAAMQAGGPLAAIEVCHQKAPAIAATVSRERGLSLSRVSARNRNPDNAPNAWQAEVLAAFEQRKAAGEAVDALDWQALAENASGLEYRYMKAIPTAPLCLQCHGQAIAPPVAEKLAEFYPDDRATGFADGDIRGAFVVTKQL